MTDGVSAARLCATGGLSRRTLLTCAGAGLFGTARAADAPPVAITIGAARFIVPAAYLFSDVSQGGASPDGLPPHFSFAFTMPDGAAAGTGLEFPPMFHPFVLDRGGGRYLVMCYRASASGPGALNISPGKELANILVNTNMYDYTKVDGMLDIDLGKKAQIGQRYVSLISSRSGVGVSAFLSHYGDGAFYWGSAEVEKPAVTTVIYIPTEKVSEAALCLNKVAELLTSWNH